MTRMNRLWACCTLFLFAGSVLAAPRHSREETILLLLRRATTQRDIAKALLAYVQDPQSGRARAECWGPPGEVAPWLRTELETLMLVLEAVSVEMEERAQPCLAGGKDSLQACDSLSDAAASLESLGTRLRVARAELLQPQEGDISIFQTAQLQEKRLVACQALAESHKRILAELEARAPHIVREWGERDKRLRASFLYRAVATDTLATVSTALGAVTSQPLGHAERLGGTDQMSVSLGAGIGEEQSLAGTRLLVSLPSLLSDLGDHVGRIWGREGADPRRLSVDDEGEQRTERSASLGLRLEVPLTRTATQGPFDDASQEISYRYGLWLLWNMGDGTDPRRKDREPCYRMAEALTPSFDVEFREVQQLERRRHALYSYCSRQSLPDWRVGVRGGVTLQAIPKQLTPPGPVAAVEPDLRLGTASLGVIAELAPWMTLQLMGRRSLHDLTAEGSGSVPGQVSEGSAALHAGGGVGGKWCGVESTVHVGVDVSTAWRNALGQEGPYEFSALVAPSLAIKLGQLAALGLSGGYVFGGQRGGWTGSAALVWDMDRFFLHEPPQLSSAP